MKQTIKKFESWDGGSVYLKKEKGWVFIMAESFGEPDVYKSIIMSKKQWKAMLNSEGFYKVKL